MSDIKYTPKQIAAIKTRNCDLLVAAAAGSGKTAVLVERIINMITGEKPIDIDKLLVVTFTKAAASEMKQKISTTITKLLEDNPSDENLQKQSILLGKASITTIDSFCNNVVRNNFYKIDIDPNFRIADNSEAEIIKSEILSELLEEEYDKENNKLFFDLIESYCSKADDVQINELILDIYKFIQSNPYPEKWLKDNAEKFNIDNDKDIFDTSWGKIIKEHIKLEISTAFSALERAFYMLNNTKETSDSYKKTLLLDKELLENIKFAFDSNIYNLYDLIKNNDLKLSRLSSSKKDTLNDETKDKIKEIRKTIKSNIKEITNIFLKSPEEHKEITQRLYPILSKLVELIISFSNKFTQVKKEKNLLDFSDIEHYCIEILIDNDGQPTKVARELQEKYEEIIIDEYQDSNSVQELILSTVSRKSIGKPNRFMVGDIKQCIYKFRLANPKIFMDKFTNYDTELNSNSKEKRIDLSQNFRSRDCVLNGINFLFYQLMTKNIGDIDYDEASALYNGLILPKPEKEFQDKIANSIEFNLIDTSEIETENLEEDNINYEYSEEINDLKAIELEATFIANKIKSIVSNKTLAIYDKNINSYRNAEYKDIVILLRTMSTTAEIFAQTLMSNGIPAFANTSSGFFEYIEVITILSLLKIIDNPRQDIPLVTVLHSSMYSFTFDELSEIKSSSKYKSYYDNILFYISEDNINNSNKQICEKLKNFVRDLNKWKSLSSQIPVNELLINLYDETNYFNYVGTLSGGAIRQANLRALHEKAIHFENTSLNGLFQFINYIEKIQQSDNNVSDAKVFSENENVVRIISIHKSKGLEYPVVFVSMLGKKINLKDTIKPFLLHQDLGFGTKYVDFERRTQTDSISRYALSKKIQQETYSEELRILYVALTRAKEKLILTGATKLTQAKLEKWCSAISIAEEVLPLHIMLSASTMLDWIVPALSRHSASEIFFKDYLTPNEIGNYKLYNDENNNSNWDINIVYRDSLVLEKRESSQKSKELFKILKQLDSNQDYSGTKEEIYNNLSWQYKNLDGISLPSKISISELKRNKEFEIIDEYSVNVSNLPDLGSENNFEMPKFIREAETVTSAKRGTAFHTVLEHIDFKSTKTEQDIFNLINNLKAKLLISEEEAKTVNIIKIKKFLNSEIGRRIASSNNIMREVPFVMGLSPYEVYNNEKFVNSKSIILIHGIIDLYFQEDNNIILLDYKTDRVSNNIENIKEKYKIQIELYKKAIERNTGKRVKEAMLYLFALDKEIYY